MRSGHPELVPGHAGGGLRLPGELLRRAAVDGAARAPDEGELAQAVKALRAAKKPLIIAGGGVLYSEASATLAAFATTHGIPVTETQAGKSSLPFDPSPQHGLDRRHRHVGCKPARRGGRRRARHRHEAPGLHDGVVGALQESGPGPDRPQRPALRCGEAPGSEHRRRRPRRPRGAVGESRRACGALRLDERRQVALRGVDEGSGRGDRGDQRASLRRPGDRRGAAGARSRGDAGVRRRRAAGRAAQALAGLRRLVVPSRIRLLVHGLRDRRRHRGQDGAAGQARSSSWSATAPTS